MKLKKGTSSGLPMTGEEDTDAGLVRQTTGDEHTGIEPPRRELLLGTNRTAVGGNSYHRSSSRRLIDANGGAGTREEGRSKRGAAGREDRAERGEARERKAGLRLGGGIGGEKRESGRRAGLRLGGGIGGRSERSGEKREGRREKREGGRERSEGRSDRDGRRGVRWKQRSREGEKRSLMGEGREFGTSGVGVRASNVFRVFMVGASESRK